MPVMLSKTYDALLDAGASEQKAREAAEEIAGYEAQFSDLKRDLTQLRAEMNGKLTLVQWMLGVTIAASVTILIKVFA